MSESKPASKLCKQHSLSFWKLLFFKSKNCLPCLWRQPSFLFYLSALPPTRRTRGVPQSKPQPRPYPGASPFGATGPRLGPPSWPLGHPRCPCRHLPAAGQAKSRHPIASLLPFLPSLSPSPVEPLPPPTARRRLGNGGGRHRLPAEGRR